MIWDTKQGDRSLTFLRKVTDQDLRTLCDIITMDKNGSRRLTETLTETDAYQLYYPDCVREMLPELIHELRLFGGNSILNFLRGEGPEYTEILNDVARRCGVTTFDSLMSNEEIERLLLSKLLSDTLHSASDNELQGMITELNLHQSEFNRNKAIISLERLSRTANVQGFIFMSSIVTSALFQLTGRGFRVAVGNIASRLFPLVLGPVSLLITSLSGIIGFAGPAYRVTVPAIIYISYLRQKIKFNSQKN